MRSMGEVRWAKPSRRAWMQIASGVTHHLTSPVAVQRVPFLSPLRGGEDI